MDLRQKRLTSEEWDALEVPVSKDEKRILKLIQNGYENVNITDNDTMSLINFVKINTNKIDDYHKFFYDKYFAQTIKKLFKSNNVIDSRIKQKTKKITIKKADQIRIQNSDKKIKTIRSNIFEFVLIDILCKYFKSSENKSFHYYTLARLLTYNVRNVNTLLISDINEVLRQFKEKTKKKELIKNACEYIEKNKPLRVYKDIVLYPHQKELFTRCKSNEPKCILYQAPTGTGKTISPVALASKNRVIFVCAAKHVGLQLAKSSISLDIKIAVAFGCEDPGGIRLHYFAAKDYTKNRRTGGIFRVDNSVGDNVEIMICDIMSYLPAMHYMMAFNKKEDIILYWDEPTITLDYETHEYHDILQKNWCENLIPNIVLSSATLPQQEDIGPCLQSFVFKFSSTNIYNIVSHDCTRTIPIIDINGMIVLPHYIFDNFKELKKSLKHIKKYKTLLRHFDIKEISKFIDYVNKKCNIKENIKINNYFENIKDITSLSLKEYYLKLLYSLKSNYEDVYKYFNRKQKPYHESNIKITTNDAYTLTDGPTIYLADNVENIGKYCLKISEIPTNILDYLMNNIGENEKIRVKVENLEREINKNKDDGKNDGNNEGDEKKKEKKEKKEKKNTDESKKDAMLQRKIDALRSHIRTIQLPPEYIPNSFEHLRKFDKNNITRAFTANIEDKIIEKIMLLEIQPMWKILLMMGIGVFAKHECVDYVSIMKELAHKQSLYLIIASTDYIYGTNYQFCHGYIGKDLGNLTQEKTIQAIGRVGRKKVMADYTIRLRNNDLIMTLFMKSENNTEVMNMNRLFGIN
jgi:hypothetical protein